ncbi:superoxide dismutase [Candidatus Woesearchaeota archaeon]|nr:superoxide dismutase [Candidatus Woesearchaeota archaeon]
MEKAVLPKLPYAYDALEPYYDAQTVELHHSKHHQAYVDGFNKAVSKVEEARESGDYSLMKHWSKEIAFHGGGHALHCMFWENLRPGSEDNAPSGALLEKIESTFGDFATFKAQFSAATAQVEGSGWGILAADADGELRIFTCENHQKAIIPGYTILLVCDVWEHAYYLKYQNRRPEWLENFFKIINWDAVASRMG